VQNYTSPAIVLNKQSHISCYQSNYDRGIDKCSQAWRLATHTICITFFISVYFNDWFLHTKYKEKIVILKSTNILAM